MKRMTAEDARLLLERLRSVAGPAAAAGEWEGRFVTESAARLKRYGEKAIFTPKQWIQFERIFRRYEPAPETAPGMEPAAGA